MQAEGLTRPCPEGGRIEKDFRNPRRDARGQSILPGKEGYAGGGFCTPLPRGRADCLRFANPAEAQGGFDDLRNASNDLKD